MNWLSPILLAVQVISSLSIIVLVLLQQGKGSEMGSAFGSGSAGSLFGASGAANFLSRMTKWAAIIFFLSTIGMAYMAHRTGGSILEGGLMQDYQAAPAPAPGDAVPTIPGSAAPSVPGDASVPSTPDEVPAQPGSVAPAQVPAQPAAPADAPSQSAP